MTKSLEGTKTLENLMKAFAGESQARNRYNMYASTEKKKGTNRLKPFFWKPPITNGSTLKVFTKRLYRE